MADYTPLGPMMPGTGATSGVHGASELIDTSPPPLADPSAQFDTSIDPATANPLLGGPAVAQRARQYHMILGQDSPGEDVIRFRLMSPGGEDGMRREFAYRQMAGLQRDRESLLRRYMADRTPGEYSPGELREIMDTLNPRAVDPNVFFERALARRITEAVNNAQQSPSQPQTNDSQALLRGFTEANERVAANRAYAQRRLEEMQALQRQTGWAESVGEHALQFVPFLSWYRMQNALQGAPRGGFLPGNNLRDQIEHYYSLPPEQAAQALDRTIAALRGGTEPGRPSGNPLNAIAFLQVAASPDMSAYSMLNAMGVADIASVIPYGTIGRLARGEGALRRAPEAAPAAPGVRTAEQTATAQQQVADAVARHPGQPAPQVEATGNYATAGLIRAREEMIEGANRAGQVDSFDSIRNHVRSLWDIDGLMRGSTHVNSNEIAQRLANNGEMLMNLGVNNPVNMSRLVPGGQAERVAADEAASLLRQQYPHAADAILNVSLARRLENLGPTIESLPKVMQPIAQRLRAAEDAITRTEGWARFREYRSVQDSLNRVIKQLGELSGQVPKAGATGNYSWREAAKAVERLEKGPLETVALHDEGKALNARLAELGLSKAERTSFDEFLKRQTAYVQAAERRGISTVPPLRGGYPLSERLVSGPGENKVVTGMGNVRYLETHFGRRDGTLFADEFQALRAAREDYKLPYGQIRIQQHGTGYGIAVHTPLNETSTAVRDAMILDIQGAPRSLANSFLSWFRLPDNQIPKELADSMKLATYGGSYLTNTVAKFIKENIGPAVWNAAERKNFVQFLEHQRVEKDPATGLAGRYSANQFEFEQQWRSMFGGMPDAKASVAYWSYVQLHDMNYAILNLGLYRDKARMGMQLFDFPTMGSAVPRQPAIEGRLIKDFPERSGEFNAGILVHDRDPGKMGFFYRGLDRGGFQAVKADEKIAELQGKGYRIIQISHFAADELRKLPEFANVKNLEANSRINFIMSREHQVAPLPYQQVPYRPGIREYDAPFFLRQGDVRNGIYYGDKTIHPFWSERDGNMWRERYETARKMLVRAEAGSPKAERELTDYLARNMPEGLNKPSEWREMFKKLELNPDQPFHVTPAHSRVADKPGVLSYEKDIKDDPYNLFHEVNLRYALERGDGMQAIAKAGTKENPYYKLAEAPFIDVLATLNRASTHLLNQRYIGDLQIKAAENFLAEFKNVLEGNLVELARDPVHTLFNARFKATTDTELLQAAHNYQVVAQNFFQQRGKAENAWYTTLQKLDDIIRSPEARQKLPEPWLLGTLTNFSSVLRSFTHHWQLASLNQLFQQASGATVIIGAEGIRGLQAIPMGLYSRAMLASSRTPEMLREAGGLLAKRHGINSEHFIEAYEGMLRSGYHHVGKEYATIGDWRAPTSVPTQGQVVRGGLLDAGMTPFKWGEEFIRHTSWYASYMAWRKQNPTAVFNDRAIQQVIGYADKLGGNMSAASSARYQNQGIVSLPTTFWSYQAHMLEQMLELAPGAFTPRQKLQILVTQGMFWGLPAATGMAIGLPVSKWVQDTLASPYDQNSPNFAPGNLLRSMVFPWTGGLPPSNTNSPIANAIINGFLNAGIQAATGSQVNISERMGPGSNRILTDLVKDKTFFEVALGAFGSTASNILGTASPFLAAAIDPFRREPTGIRLTPHDFAQILEAQPQASQALRAYYAFQIGKYFDRGGLPVTEMTRMESLVFGLTGLTPMHISQMYSILSNERTTREAQNREMRNVQYWFNQALTHTDEGRFDDASAALRRMGAHIALGGWRDDQLHIVWSRLMRGNEDTMERVLRRNAMNNPEMLRLYQQYNREYRGLQ